MRTTIFTTFVLCLLSSTVLAQNSSQSNSDANAQNSAGAAINQNFESPPGDQRIETTPSPYAPTLDAGTNSCAVSVSGGATITGFGLSVGASTESDDCKDRNWVALMSARGWDDVAKAYACLHHEKAAAAFEAAGYECPERPKMQNKKINVSQENGNNSVPGYCDDGGWATDETIRENCPNAEHLMRGR